MDSQIRVKTGLAEMLKGGVIMDVVNAEHARIAEEMPLLEVRRRALDGCLQKLSDKVVEYLRK